MTLAPTRQPATLHGLGGGSRQRLGTVLIVGVASVVMAGCSLTEESPTPTPAPSPRVVIASPTPSPPPTPTPSPTPTPKVGLAACPPPAALATLQQLPGAGGKPDDVFAGPDGSLWITDETNGRIAEVSSGGQVVFSTTDPNAPEGIMITPDGTLYVAEQRANRVVSFRPPSTRPAVVANLPNRTRTLGIDGLGVDSVGARLLIPDSPNGALRTMPLGGGALTTLATGLGRPVAATVGPSGDIDVASESGPPDLVRISSRGVKTPILRNAARLDEVVSDGKLLYVTDLDHGTVSAVEETSGATRTLVTGARDPQGLALLPDGRLVLVDSATGTLRAVPTCA